MSKLDKVINLINKRFGDGAISVGASKNLSLSRVSTGIIALDLAAGGGLPRGSVIEFFGKEGAGKTTAALKTISKFQSEGLSCAYIDMEHALNPEWMQQLGVNLESLVISQPDTAELAIDILDTLVRSKELDLIVFDSLAAAIPQEELDKSASDSQMALQARLFSKMCRKIVSALQPGDINDPKTYNNTVVLFINQVREKVGIVYGNPNTTPGGHAILHTAKIRVEFHAGNYIKNKDRVIGKEIKFKVVKNKTWKPYVTGMFELYFDGSINNDITIINEAIKNGLVKQSGAVYEYKNIKERGKDNFIKVIKENNLMEDITSLLYNIVLKGGTITC